MGSKAKKAPGGFQFVNISKPTDAAKHRRQVRSHAARISKPLEEPVFVPPLLGAGPDHINPDHVANGQPVVLGDALEDDTVEEADRDDHWSLPLIPTRPAGHVSANPSSLLDPSDVDPFRSWMRPLTPFEGTLLKHFVKHVVINDLSAMPWSMPQDQSLSRQGPRISWTQSAAMDVGMMYMVFLAASRSLSKRQHPEIYGPIATKYKAECLRLLNLALAAEGNAASDATITKTLAMASEEFFSGSKPTADRHLQAAAYMINSRGSPSRLSMWQHDDNVHMWTHWPEIMAGVDSHTICEFTIARHFRMTLEQSRSGSHHDSLHQGIAGSYGEHHCSE